MRGIPFGKRKPEWTITPVFRRVFKALSTIIQRPVLR